MRLPDPCLVVLVGATAAGKSDWARAWFEPDQIVSSDRLRAVVGRGERDQRASRDAFELLDLIVAKRLRPRADHRDRHDRAGGQAPRGVARAGGGARACRPTRSCSTRRRRSCASATARAATPVPPKVVAAQLREAAAVFATLGDEGFAGVHAAGPVELVPPGFLDAPAAAARQAEAPLALEFGLQISRFGWEGGDGASARRRRAGGRGRRLHVACG